MDLLQEGGPLLGPVSGCLVPRNELSRGDTWADKARDFIGKGALVESSRVGEPRRTAQLLARSLGFYDDGISFQIVFGQSFWLRVLLGSACIAQLKQGWKANDEAPRTFFSDFCRLSAASPIHHNWEDSRRKQSSPRKDWWPTQLVGREINPTFMELR